MSDMELQKTIRRGDKDGQVRLIQEWLCLHRHNVAVDGDFGPATEAAVKAFQAQKKLTNSGVVDENTFAQLVAPMRAAMAPIAAQRRSLGDMVVAYAQQHLQHAVVGGRQVPRVDREHQERDETRDHDAGGVHHRIAGEAASLHPGHRPPTQPAPSCWRTGPARRYSPRPRGFPWQAAAEGE